jgi:GTP-binding protein HflX
VPHTNGADVGWLYGHAEIIGKDEPDEEGQTYEVRVEPRHKASFTQRFAGRIEAA